MRRETDEKNCPAFEALLAMFGPETFGFAQRVYSLVRVVDAEDCWSEAWAKVWHKRQTLRDPCTFRAWLYTIVRRQKLTFLAYQKRHPADLVTDLAASRCPDIDWAEAVELLLGPDSAFGPDRQAGGPALAETTIAALGKMSATLREVVRLFIFECMSESAIATRLGIAVGTVRSRKFAGFRELRVSLQSLRPASCSILKGPL
jgi:RNA polymerase sigma factor (sigma-70 family)